MEPSSDLPADQQPDSVDLLLTAWREARPDLDPAPLGLVGRVLVLATQLEAGAEEALASHGLSLGQFDILATLRRFSTKGGLTPGALLKSVMLSSGGMTSRLDKLEASGLIARKPDLNDRRGVVVDLTAKGRKVVDAATVSRFRQAQAALPPMTDDERQLLATLLRRWILALNPEKAPKD